MDNIISFLIGGELMLGGVLIVDLVDTSRKIRANKKRKFKELEDLIIANGKRMAELRNSRY